MDEKRLDHFRSVLLEQLRQHTENVRADQAAALESNDDGVKDSVDMSLLDVNREIGFRVGFVIDLYQLLHGDVRVDLGGGEPCVAQQLLNVAQVSAAV